MRTPFIIKIPPGLKTWEADNWRSVAEALTMSLSTTNKVDSPTTGLATVQGKVRINQYDQVPDYLEKKIEGGNDIDFVSTNDGLGSKKYTVNLNVIAQDEAPSAPTNGMLWYDTDEPEPEYFDIGDNAADTDFKLRFLGETHDGIIAWMEDEDYFEFSDDVVLDETLTVSGDTALSSDLTVAGDTALAAVTATSFNIVCHDNQVVCYENEVVTWT